MMSLQLVTIESKLGSISCLNSEFVEAPWRLISYRIVTSIGVVVRYMTPSQNSQIHW